MTGGTTCPAGKKGEGGRSTNTVRIPSNGCLLFFVAYSSRLAHEVHLVPRTVVPAALQPAGVARVAGEVVPRGGVELVAVEVVPRQRLRLQRHAFPDCGWHHHHVVALITTVQTRFFRFRCFA